METKKPIKVWEITRCPCGHAECGVYGTNNGHFSQGSGYSLEDVRLIAPAALTTDLLYRTYRYLLTNMNEDHRATPEGQHFLATVRATLALAYGVEPQELNDQAEHERLNEHFLDPLSV